jgi:hypothetical protein
MRVIDPIPINQEGSDPQLLREKVSLEVKDRDRHPLRQKGATASSPPSCVIQSHCRSSSCSSDSPSCSYPWSDCDPIRRGGIDVKESPRGVAELSDRSDVADRESWSDLHFENTLNFVPGPDSSEGNVGRSERSERSRQHFVMGCALPIGGSVCSDLPLARPCALGLCLRGLQAGFEEVTSMSVQMETNELKTLPYREGA